MYCVQKNTDSTDPAVRIEHHHLICNAMVEYSEYMTRKDKGAIKIEIGSIFSEGVENDGHKMVRFSDESTNNLTCLLFSKSTIYFSS